MKTSHNRKAHRLIAAGTIALAALLAAPAVQAQSTGTTQYTPWAGAAGQQMKSMIADLKAKIAAAEQSQAASPDFLADLKVLVAKYEAMQTSGQTAAGGMAPGTQLLLDTF